MNTERTMTATHPNLPDDLIPTLTRLCELLGDPALASVWCAGHLLHSEVSLVSSANGHRLLGEVAIDVACHALYAAASPAARQVSRVLLGLDAALGGYRDPLPACNAQFEALQAVLPQLPPQ